MTQTDLGQRDQERAQLATAYSNWRTSEAAAGRTRPPISNANLGTKDNAGLDAAELLVMLQAGLTVGELQRLDLADAINPHAKRGAALARSRQTALPGFSDVPKRGAAARRHSSSPQIGHCRAIRL